MTQPEDGEGPVHVAAGPAGGFGRVVPSGQVQGADGEVSEGGHGPRPGAGADGGVVFAVERAADDRAWLTRCRASNCSGTNAAWCSPQSMSAAWLSYVSCPMPVSSRSTCCFGGIVRRQPVVWGMSAITKLSSEGRAAIT